MYINQPQLLFEKLLKQPTEIPNIGDCIYYPLGDFCIKPSKKDP